MAVLTLVSTSEGGYPPTTWYPAGIFLIGLLVVALMVAPPRERISRSVFIAICCFAAYAAWAYLSIIWAAQAGDAWDGANRVALYGVVFALFALWRPRGSAALLIIGTLALGIVLIGLVELLRVTAAEGGGGFFYTGRLSEPTGYANANAALWTLGALASVFLASRTEVPTLLRAAFLSGAVILVGLALLAGSRGWLFTAPLGALALFVFSRERVPVLTVLALFGIATAIIAEPTASVYAKGTSAAELDTLIDDATRAILITAGLALAVGAALAAWHRRARVPQAADSAALVVLAGAVAIGAATWMVMGDPVGTISDAWQEFRGGESAQTSGSRFSTGLGSDRYDQWRVAVDAFERHPLHGIGADNFLQEYLRAGETTEQARYPHSFELGVLSQTGVVGALLLLAGAVGGGVVAAAAGLLRRRGETAVGAAALAIFVYWLAHASIDWLWEFPGLTGPAVACLGLAAALMPRRAVPARSGRGRRGIALVPPAVLLAAAFALPWVSQLEIRRAAERWPQDPDDAFARIDRAASLNPLASEPRMVGGVIAIRLGRLSKAEDEFAAALAREPANSYAWLQMGAIASARGDRSLALRRVERSAELSPRDRLVRATLRSVRRGNHVSPAAISERALRYVRARTE